MATLLIWQDDAGQTVSVRFDAVPSILHEAVSIVSDHPVEDGVDISDHVRPGLRRLSLTGIVSNTPGLRTPSGEVPGRVVPTPPADLMRFESVELDIPAPPFKLGNPLGQAIDAASSFVVGELGNTATLLRAQGPFDRKGEVWRALDEDARANARLVRVVTELRDYDSMVVERVAAPREATSTTAWEFPVELREIRVVDSLEVDAPQPAEVLGYKKKARGSQSTKTGADEEGSKEDAVLRSAAARTADGGVEFAKKFIRRITG